MPDKAPNPSGVSMTTEAVYKCPNGYGFYDFKDGDTVQTSQWKLTANTQNVWFHHGKTANFAYGDGHAASLGEKDFVNECKERINGKTAVYVWDQDSQSGKSCSL